MTTHNIVGAQLAARIFGIALTALFLATPNAALAQNECGLQVGTTPVECGDASYGSGVTYDAVGDLFIEFTNPTVTTIGGNGVALTGDGVEGIDFDSATTATELQSAGTTGPLLGVTTEDGDIVIATEEMDADASAAGVTHGIFAQSTGSGGIDITTTGPVDAASGTNPADSIGIQAITGSGSLTITASGTVSGNDAAIDAATGTGLLTINVTGGSGTVGQGSSLGIRTDAGGDAVINIASGRTVSAGFAGTVLDLSAAGETIVNNAGFINAQSNVAIRAAGSTLVLNNDDRLTGRLDFSNLTGGYTFNNNAGAVWSVSSNVQEAGDLGAGTLNNAGTIELSRNRFISAPGTTFTGTAGSSVLEMSRMVLAGGGQSDCTAPTVAPCLDLTGGTTAGQTAILVSTDDFSNPDPFTTSVDKPISPGVVLVDVGGGSSQADHFVLHPDSFWRFDRDPGRTVDFIEVPIYAEDPVYGAVLETGGLFDYALLYNPNTQQHLLASVPQREGIEYVSFIHEALSIWHTTSDVVAGRQADLRHGGQRGGWIRIVSEQTERDSTPTLTTHGNSFTYDNDYKLNTRSLIAGYDLTATENHVLGVHLGIIAARQDYRAGSSSRDETRGATFGAYAGWWNDAGLTLDGTLNANMLTIDHKPGRDLETSESNIRSIGLRAEAGWRLPLMGDALYVQPLATAAYAQADVENLNLRDYDASFENADSSRAALGVRLGGGTDLTGERFSRVKYWLTARAWEEYAEDGRVEYQTGGDPLAVEDDISEGFEEVGLGVSLTSPDENLEVFLSGNVRSGDQTDGNNVTIGARMNW